MSAPATVVDTFLEALPETAARRVAPGEWGLSIEAAGWPLHVGLRLHRGLLRLQAEALAPDRVGDHELLLRNRGLVLVRYAHTGAGAVWVHGELAEEWVTPAWLDRVLGLVVDAATVARERARG